MEQDRLCVLRPQAEVPGRPPVAFKRYDLKIRPRADLSLQDNPRSDLCFSAAPVKAAKVKVTVARSRITEKHLMTRNGCSGNLEYKLARSRCPPTPPPPPPVSYGVAQSGSASTSFTALLSISPAPSPPPPTLTRPMGQTLERGLSRGHQMAALVAGLAYRGAKCRGQT